MSRPIVNHWLATLRRGARTVAEVREIEGGIAIYERWVATNNPKRLEPGVPETIEKARQLLVDYDGSKINHQQRLDLVASARLFDLSDEVAEVAARRANELVGAPDLEDLPFPACWFRMEYRDEKNNLDVLGYLISRDGWLGICFRDKDGHPDFAYEHVADETGWAPDAILTAWTLWLLARVVAGHVAERPALDSFAVRRELAKTRAAGVRVPMPELYTIHLDARRAGHAIGRIIEARNGPAYRYEVRQHERMLVHRGRWPVGDELAADFRRRGYTVERGDALDERAVLGLDLRGLPPGERAEWVAWRFAKVREHEAGPKNAPVRRAVRVVA